MFFLVDCFGCGLFGSELDNVYVFLFYQLVVKFGYVVVVYCMVVCCEIGNDEGGGICKDLVKVFQWYKCVVILGDILVMYKVGMILFKGLFG